jgi:hypothetical protein
MQSRKIGRDSYQARGAQMVMRRRLLNQDWMLTNPIRFLACDIILSFVPGADVVYVFSKISRLIANFCIIAVILMLAVDHKAHRMGAGQKLFSLVACTLLVAPLGVTIGFSGGGKDISGGGKDISGGGKDISGGDEDISGKGVYANHSSSSSAIS